MLSRYARTECLVVSVATVALCASCLLFGVWFLLPLPLIFGACILLFYRDPVRFSPKDRNVAVSPADGKISSIHEVGYFEPFDGPAVCVRVFLSVFDVHVNYCPCHALVQRITHKPGEHISVLNPRSAEVNEAITIVFFHPTHKSPLIAVRQIAGLFARTVYCALQEGQVVQRGAKLGIMKLGSTAELYLPVTMDQVLVKTGQRVVGAVTPLAMLPVAKPNTGDFAPVEPVEKEIPLPVDAPRDEPEEPAAAVEMDAPVIASVLSPLPQAEHDDEIPAALPATFGNDDDAPVGTDTAIIPSDSILPPEPDMAEESADLTDHAISQVMAADEVTDSSHTLSASDDGEVLTARMENAGTDLMLHPAEHGEENGTLAASLAGLRPEAQTDAEDAQDDILAAAERQPNAGSADDSGDWKIIPTSKKSKKPMADGLLWEENA